MLKKYVKNYSDVGNLPTFAKETHEDESRAS